MSEQFDRWLASLSPEERERFIKSMRHKNTFLAEDLTDVMAILAQIKENKKH